ncbi:MAG: histidine--tRNA ligase [Ferruginibacter sp.]|nr:histidine--tRNA ligase [Ferruginibacter sp.]
MAKPSLPQGTRDFSAEVVRKRNYIFSTIKAVFEIYGFEPLETPAMENLETLMGKYGDEGDKLIFKVLNNGLNNPKNIDKAKAGFEKLMEGKSTAELTERALKYDLTIPFARHVAMNHTKLTFPHRRYQVQPVWRADRPQKGRYREFTQCDADIVGSTSLMNEVELANMYHQVFINLNLPGYQLKINNRKILAALSLLAGGQEKMIDITIAIDKLDKIGLEKVKEELRLKELTEEQISVIEKYLTITGSNLDRIEQIKSLLGHISQGAQGINELEQILNLLRNVNIEIDFTLARGLNYYTGSIFEVKAPNEVQMGSIGGGGRYDDLTGLFDVPGIPGVGISFGVDRIFDVLEELQLFPTQVDAGTQVIFFNMGAAESIFAFGIMQQLRAQSIPCELYHEPVKINKQFSYAERKKIPFAVIIGSKEMEQNYCLVKNLSTGVQEVVVFDRLQDFFKQV